tara:strand:- start:796 stop:1308 length:513 start_codon:yes stop_codon:yes gene_type:complete
MKKKFEIGDKVKFIRSNDYGTIQSIVSERKVQVEDSSKFLSIVNVDEIIPFDKSTNSVSSYGDLTSNKEKNDNAKNLKKVISNLNVVKLDLHIENLSADCHVMTNFEIIQIQIKKCEDLIMKSLNSNVHKLIIVHGIGEGVLKKEVHDLLNRYQLRYFESLNGGSTEVMI